MDATTSRVRDVMRERPKTLPADATVADVRRMFANSHVLTALLVDGAAFVGVIDRDGVEGAPDDAPARSLARSEGVTIGPDVPVGEAMARLAADGGSRLVVLGPDGRTLQGLLCLNSTRDGFCQ